MVDTIEIMGLDEIETENTAVENIDAEIINLNFLGVDQSGSMGRWTGDMKKCLADFKIALKESKEVDEILIARANFFGSKKDIVTGGYKKVDEFDTDFNAGGGTPLYDVIVEGTTKLLNYIQYLKNQGMRVKAVFAIFSDGEDNTSQAIFADAKAKIAELQKQEITTAFIAFGAYAEAEAKGLDFKNIKVIKSTDDAATIQKELRRAFDATSKSMIASSKAVLGNQDDFFKF